MYPCILKINYIISRKDPLVLHVTVQSGECRRGTELCKIIARGAVSRVPASVLYVGNISPAEYTLKEGESGSVEIIVPTEPHQATYTKLDCGAMMRPTKWTPPNWREDYTPGTRLYTYYWTHAEGTKAKDMYRDDLAKNKHKKVIDNIRSFLQ
jgi:hypothetical protein